MQFIRKTAAGLVASLLLTFLLTFGLTFGLLKVFGSPGPIKDALKQSGFYTNIVPNALDKVQQDRQKEGTAGSGDSIPIDKPEVRTVIQNAASPSYLEPQVDKALDATYAWLQGKTKTLDFAVDSQGLKARLADGLGQYAQQHLASLPACPGRTSDTDIDPFQATCLPKGADVTAISAKAKDQMLNGDFLKDANLSAKDIKIDDGTKTIDQKYKNVPDIYQKTVMGIYGSGVLAALLGVALVFLSKTRRAGVKRVSIVAITGGAMVALLGWSISFGLHRAESVIIKDNDPIQKSGFSVAQLLANDLRTWWMGYGILLIVLGVTTLLLLKFVFAQSDDGTEEEPAKAAEKAELAEAGLKDDAPGENEQYLDKLVGDSAAKPKPRPRPSKKLVQ